MLNNTMYRKNIQQISKRMRDQSQTPLERAIYWIEYSIRHNGTHFLNLKSRDLPLFITGGFDIYLFLLLVSCAIIILPTLAIRYSIRYSKRKMKIKTQ
nr:unnamed protein product [Callosobruchus chinensis]